MKRAAIFIASVFALASNAVADRVYSPLTIGNGASSSSVLTFDTGGTSGNANVTADTSENLDVFVNSLLKLSASGSTNPALVNDTADAADTKRLLISGGGTAAASRGAVISVAGNENADEPGAVSIGGGGGVAATSGTAFSVGTTEQSAALVVRNDGRTTFSDAPYAAQYVLNGASGLITMDTESGSDNKSLYVSGGGYSAVNHQRGGYVTAHGNEVATYGGRVEFVSGNESTSSATSPGFTFYAPLTAGTSPTSVLDVYGSGLIKGKSFSSSYVGTDPQVGGSTPFQLTAFQNRTQVINPSGAITVKLPTTSILAGETVTIVNRSTNLVTVQSSGANLIDAIATGTISIVALQDTPTTAAHWFVSYLNESGTFVANFTGPRSPAVTFRYGRTSSGNGSQVSLVSPDNNTSACSPATFFSSGSSDLPQRLRPTQGGSYTIGVQDNSAPQASPGQFDIANAATSGQMTIGKSFSSGNFTAAGNCGWYRFSVSYTTN